MGGLLLTQPWQGGSVGWSAVLCTEGLQVRYPVRAQMGGNQWMFLSHITMLMFLSLSLSLSLLLLPSPSLPLSIKSINISWGED